MEKEKELTFKGSKKDEAYEALDRIKKFVLEKPDLDHYRHMYISVDDTDDTHHVVTDGGKFKGNYKINVNKTYTEARKLIDDVEIKRFYISATIIDEK